jgi:hypothetical protein
MERSNLLDTDRTTPSRVWWLGVGETISEYPRELASRTWLMHWDLRGNPFGMVRSVHDKIVNQSGKATKPCVIEGKQCDLGKDRLVSNGTMITGIAASHL